MKSNPFGCTGFNEQPLERSVGSLGMSMNMRMDRRLSPRRIANIEAKIVFNAGRTERACIVRDLSEGGARLEVATVSGIPPTFDLIVPGRPPQPCRVAWRALKEMGVSYR